MPRARVIARRVLLAAGSLLMWGSAQAAELLTSIDRIDGGRVLSCDYESGSDRYQLACEDVFGEFSLQCFVDVEWPRLPPPVPGMERFGVICPVTPERSVQGNALRLECFKHDAKEIERHIDLFGIPPGVLKARLRMAQCASAKVDIDWNDFYTTSNTGQGAAAEPQR
jgi:hypothetical protein